MSVKQKINYIGSKYSLIEYIYDKIKENVEDIENKVFCDLFAGTHIVGNFFKDKVRKVISNDMEHYSFVIGQNYIKNNVEFDYEHLLKELNDIDGIEGYIFNYYSDGGKSKRLFFNNKNGKKIDAIRQKIENWKNEKYINDNQYYFLLTSLIEASDKVANTTSVYGAYLKEIKKTADKDLIMVPSYYKIVNNQTNDVYNQDSNNLIKDISGDILYIDTPYNHRQYGSNYHILNAISKYDFSVEPRGVVGLMDYNKSKYCYKNEAIIVFDDLIKNSNFEHIFISYSNEGILSEDSIMKVLSSYGISSKYEREYKTFKADSARNNKSKNTFEYLFYLKKELI